MLGTGRAAPSGSLALHLLGGPASLDPLRAGWPTTSFPRATVLPTSHSKVLGQEDIGNAMLGAKKRKYDQIRADDARQGLIAEMMVKNRQLAGAALLIAVHEATHQFERIEPNSARKRHELDNVETQFTIFIFPDC